MSQTKFCGKCGKENPTDNNYCNHCGQQFPKPEILVDSIKREKPKASRRKTVKNNAVTISSARHKTVLSENYNLLREKLLELNKRRGEFHLYCGEYFIQFIRQKGSYQLTMDMGAFDESDKEYVVQLMKTGFSEIDGSLKKTMPIANLHDLIDNVENQVREIFEKILNISPDVFFRFEENFTSKANSNDRVKNSLVEKQNTDFQKLKEGCIPGLFLIILISLVVGYCKNDKGTSEKEEFFTSSDMKFNAYFFAKEFVTKEVKQPHTAEFPTLPESCDFYPSDSSYIITSHVDAQNYFGAMIRNKFEVRLKYLGGDKDDGHNWELVNLNFYE